MFSKTLTRTKLRFLKGADIMFICKILQNNYFYLKFFNFFFISLVFCYIDFENLEIQI